MKKIIIAIAGILLNYTCQICSSTPQKASSSNGYVTLCEGEVRKESKQPERFYQMIQDIKNVSDRARDHKMLPQLENRTKQWTRDNIDPSNIGATAQEMIDLGIIVRYGYYGVCHPLLGKIIIENALDAYNKHHGNNEESRIKTTQMYHKLLNTQKNRLRKQIDRETGWECYDAQETQILNHLYSLAPTPPIRPQDPVVPSIHTKEEDPSTRSRSEEREWLLEAILPY